MCQENPPKIKEKIKQIYNRRKLLWYKDLRRRRQPRWPKSLGHKDLPTFSETINKSNNNRTKRRENSG